MNKKITIASILVISILATSMAGTVLARPFYKDITVEKASRLILSKGHHDLVVIDLRPAFMYASGHIPGAINVPVLEFTGGTPPVILHWDVLEAWMESTEGQSHLNNKIIIHCFGGLASPEGAQNLIDESFKKVNNMDGGFIAWMTAGYPTETQY
jgi:rhodanese-related sulfurtransferase